MEQSELPAGAFEPLSLFEVSLYPRRVQNTLSRDTIKLGSYWSLPKPDARLTEHVNNFGMSILIVHVFEKPTQVTALPSESSSSSFWTVMRGVSSQNLPVFLFKKIERVDLSGPTGAFANFDESIKGSVNDKKYVLWI